MNITGYEKTLERLSAWVISLFRLGKHNRYLEILLGDSFEYTSEETSENICTDRFGRPWTSRIGRRGTDLHASTRMARSSLRTIAIRPGLLWRGVPPAASARPFSYEHGRRTARLVGHSVRKAQKFCTMDSGKRARRSIATWHG